MLFDCAISSKPDDSRDLAEKIMKLNIDNKLSEKLSLKAFQKVS